MTKHFIRRYSTALKQFFDTPSHQYVSPKCSGLFQIPRFKRPEDLVAAAHETLELSQSLLTTITSSSNLNFTIKRLDRLSDLMCSVVDVAEFVRSSHPDPEYVKAAEECYAILANLLGSLNTNPALYNVSSLGFSFFKLTHIRSWMRL